MIYKLTQENFFRSSILSSHFNFYFWQADIILFWLVTKIILHHYLQNVNQYNQPIKYKFTKDFKKVVNYVISWDTDQNMYLGRK